MRLNALLNVALTICGLFLIHANAYRFGVGIYDITGPAAEVNMMGYGNWKQISSGIHLRLFSRAFIIENSAKLKPILFISLDVCMTSQIVKTKVVERLQQKFGDRFSHQNVLISAIHTHSGPGGYLQYLLYTITSLGFVRNAFDEIVDGIVQSVILADANMIDGRIYIAEGELYNASINRSPAAYLMNPAEERARFKTNVDTKMTLLKFVDSDGKPVGMINWFAVHPVSMNESNLLISSDNKGLASMWFEAKLNRNRVVGKGPFVAAFAQSNEGDVSPNLKGPRCIDTGLPCDFVHSTCDGKVEKCIAFGPGKDMFESTKIIAQRQMNRAMELFESASEELTGPIKFVHQFVNMTNIPMQYKNISGRTCKPAMGYSFAAGTMDGPGDFDFQQGTLNGSVLWNIVRDLIKRPSKELQDCHAPKPILLATGEISFPYPWQPDIVETQIFQIGNLLITAVPGEFTTMSGRRIRDAVEKSANQAAAELLNSHPRIVQDTKFRSVIAGLSNLYTSYIATPEEYQLQRYEAASTIYGPLTLPAYIQQFQKLAAAIVKDTKLPTGPTPPYFVDKLISLLPDVMYDTSPWEFDFGDVLVSPNRIYTYVDDVVKARFVSANPRNVLDANHTFLTVERLDEDTGEYVVNFTDANWETKFMWGRSGVMDFLLGHSQADISWEVSDIDGLCHPGIYRIRHFGVAKSLFFRTLKPFVGYTKPFKVECKQRGSIG